MKIKKYAIAMLSCAMMAMTAFSAAAAEKIDSVHIRIVPEDDNLSPGETYSGMEPEVSDSAAYYVDEYDVSTSSPEAKKSYTYTIDVLPESGYSFASDVNVDVYGATSVTVKSKSSSRLELKVKTYPYHVLEEPSGIKIDEEKKEATWNAVKHAKNYSVIVSYKNKNGDERETKKTVSKTSIDLKGYIGKYEDVDISVRAMKGTTEADRFISNSDYIRSDGSEDSENSGDEYEFNIPTTGTGSINSSESSSKSPSSSNNNGPSANTGTLNNKNDGWNGSGNDWSYIHNGKKVTGWLGINSTDWYLFDNSGKMLSGWQKVDGRWYLLNTNHDGTYGKMLTGWQKVNGTWYYLNTAHDGTYGAMFENRTTPDGYRVDRNGAWIR